MKGPIRDEDGEASLLSPLIYYILGSGGQYGRLKSDYVFSNLFRTALLTWGMFVTIVQNNKSKRRHLLPEF